MEVFTNVQKIKLLLENIFDGNIVIDETHIKKLLLFLEDRTENSPGKRILESPWFSDLIYCSLEKCKDSSTLVKVFLIKIVTILFKNELQYSKMQMHGLHALQYAFKHKPGIDTTQLHVAGIEMVLAQITHFSGLHLSTQERLWRRVLIPQIQRKSKEVTRATYKFMAKFIWKLNECNIESSLREVLGDIIEPILSSGYLTVPVLDTESDTALADQISPYINTLLAILVEADNHTSANKVIPMLQYYKFEFFMHQICNTTKNKKLHALLNPCIFRFNLHKYQPLLNSKKINEFCAKMTIFQCNYLNILIRHRAIYVLVDYVIQSNIIWSNFEKIHASEFEFPLTFERNGHTFDFSLQIIAHLTVPTLRYGSNEILKELIGTTDLAESYIGKMLKSLTDYIHSSCYIFSVALQDGGIHMKRQIVSYTLKEILRLKGHITKSQSGPLFQSLYYMLELFVSSYGAVLSINDTPLDLEDLKIFTHVLDGMKMLLKEHNIPWYENIEIVNVQATMLNLLRQFFLTTKQVAQILDLITICVSKFLSPNMSLLVENKCTQDSTLNEIGEVMMRYTQHEDWAVRDSALNLLYRCTEISFIKYVPLRKVIRDNSLNIIAAKAALTDPEYYSQCTALKCLAAAAKIDCMWQEILVDNPVIFIQLVYILRNHGEGMVRKEVTNVLTEMYANQKVAPNSKNNLYEVMQTVALDDLEWEVQLSALNFWKRAIHNHLTYRGMIGGKFPSVTFSKEKRKIVILDDSEIQRQLTGIMNHLSKIGCLTVLLACMDDNYNVQVMKLAYSIAKEVIDMLNKYKYEKTTSSTDILPLPLTLMEEDFNLPIYPWHTTNTCSEADKNKVIDSILSVNLSDHIINLHNSHYQGKKTEMDVDFVYCPRKELVHPDNFIDNFRNNDYSSMIECKKNYNEDRVTNLDAMLNEILNSQMSISSIL